MGSAMTDGRSSPTAHRGGSPLSRTSHATSAPTAPTVDPGRPPLGLHGSGRGGLHGGTLRHSGACYCPADCSSFSKSSLCIYCCQTGSAGCWIHLHPSIIVVISVTHRIHILRLDKDEGPIALLARKGVEVRMKPVAMPVNHSDGNEASPRLIGSSHRL